MVKRVVPLYGSPEFRQLWRLIDGAVANAMNDHPDYFTPKGRRITARQSIVKRVANSIDGYARQRAYGGSKSSLAAESEAGAGSQSLG